MAKKTKAVGERWARRVRYWQKALWLSDWDFSATLTEDDASTDEGDIAAEAYAAPKYKEACIKGYYSELVDMSDKKMDAIACHEVCHVLLSPINHFTERLIASLPVRARELMGDEWSAIKERATTDLQQVVFYADHDLRKTRREHRKMREQGKKKEVSR